jgi:hypothetical protein
MHKQAGIDIRRGVADIRRGVADIRRGVADIRDYMIIVAYNMTNINWPISKS